jgi:hypothetical protein
MNVSCISLLTDFGLYDEYVGVMKGVIASINPYANVIDICHSIKPQDIVQAAYMLWYSHAYFPGNTVHVTIIDPGVGTDRRIIALKANQYFFLAPDNGVLSLIIKNYKCLSVHVTESKYFLSHVSGTFHGRDIFAPVAAHLSECRQLNTFGEMISTNELVKIEDIHPIRQKNQLEGKVVMTDHFGNLITNISQQDLILDRYCSTQIDIKDVSIQGISKNYMQVQKGRLLAIIGSKGLLEISISSGNAKLELGVEIGCQIRVMQNKALTN